jgi:hypothetical protein
MRKEASEKAEMVSQVLFGESFKILEVNTTGNFSYIKLDFDNYEGWIDSKTIVYLNEEEFHHYSSLNAIYPKRSLTLVTDNPKHQPLRVSAGSSLVIEKGVLQPGLFMYPVPAVISTGIPDDKRSELEDLCLHFISVPYIWGGRSDAGVDCSGLVQNLYKQIGIVLPRDAPQQASVGKTLNFLNESKPGDLAFFDNHEGEISHVGMILKGNRIIHASGVVKIDWIDHQGIYSEKFNKYTHSLRIIKNIID